MTLSSSFEWDEAKNKSNIAKHGISFEQAKTIFEGAVLTLPSPYKGEKRELSIGLYKSEVLIVVVHTDRSGKTRIISARPAKRKERNYYEKEIRKTTHP